MWVGCLCLSVGLDSTFWSLQKPSQPSDAWESYQVLKLNAEQMALTVFSADRAIVMSRHCIMNLFGDPCLSAHRFECVAEAMRRPNGGLQIRDFLQVPE